MTNVNRIRAMSDEELAEMGVMPFMYMSGYHSNTFYRGAYSGMDYDTHDEAYAGELEWLRAENKGEKI